MNSSHFEIAFLVELLIYNFLPVGTTIAAIISLLVLSDGNRASTADAFTLFENNSGWSDGMFQSYAISSLLLAIYSHRRMGVYAGFHIANVDPDWLYVTL